MSLRRGNRDRGNFPSTGPKSGLLGADEQSRFPLCPNIHTVLVGLDSCCLWSSRGPVCSHLHPYPPFSYCSNLDLFPDGLQEKEWISLCLKRVRTGKSEDISKFGGCVVGSLVTGSELHLLEQLRRRGWPLTPIVATTVGETLRSSAGDLTPGKTSSLPTGSFHI